MNAIVTRVLLAAFVLFSTPALCVAQETLKVHNLVIAAIEQVNVPAVETGLLAYVDTKEGETVRKGDLLARLDDEQARISEALAKNQLEIATEQAKNFHALELAGTELLRQKQIAKQHSLLQDIAHRKADNNVRVMAAKKAEAVANNELARAIRARNDYVDSVSQSEIDGLTLAHERSQLESRQAEIDREIDRLNAESEDESEAIHRLSVRRAEVEVKLADGDKRITELQVTSHRHEAELASLVARRHRIHSPISGVVAEVYRQPGEWVQVGDPVVRVVHLDRLRAEGFVSAERCDQLRAADNVDLTIHVPGRPDVRRNGRIVFVSPEIDSVNNEVRFWIEFENPGRDILPGMRLSFALRAEDA